MRTLPIDFETRANRYLGAMQCVRDMLGNTANGSLIDAEPLAYLLDLLNEEAVKVVVPHRMAANDEDEDL